MISEQLLRILRCPVSGTPLALVDGELLAQVNAAIQAGKLNNRAGEVVSHPLDGGLTNQDRSLLMPILDGIPNLIADEAIPLSQLDSSSTTGDPSRG